MALVGDLIALWRGAHLRSAPRGWAYVINCGRGSLHSRGPFSILVPNFNFYAERNVLASLCCLLSELSTFCILIIIIIVWFGWKIYGLGLICGCVDWVIIWDWLISNPSSWVYNNNFQHVIEIISNQCPINDFSCGWCSRPYLNMRSWSSELVLKRVQIHLHNSSPG